VKSINECVSKAATRNMIVPGFNVFGYEDALAVVRAAERAEHPVLLLVNRDARAALDVAHWGALLSSIASQASVPVGVHLDHCEDMPLIIRAIHSGFTSVMYDGSKLTLDENIANSKEIVAQAHARNIFVEGEIGFVPYDDKGEQSDGFTRPEEARRLHLESGLDWIAVSIGNIHRLVTSKAPISFDALAAIESACTAPLVIHGATGISDSDFQRLKRTRVAKVNIGTALRQTFGTSLRKEFEANPSVFDRLALFRNPVKQVEEKAFELIVALSENSGE